MIRHSNNHPGLGLQIKIKRELNSDEHLGKLFQYTQSTISPHFWGCLIKFNSTYIELIDINYQRKGLMSLLFIFFSILIYFPTSIFINILAHPGYTFEDHAVEYIFTVPMQISFVILLLYIAKQELFKYTHYPIRLNRKTKIAHVFRTNGTVLSIPWNDLYFSLTQTKWMGIPKAYIAAHVMDENERIIQETFVLGGYLTPRPEIALSLWEYCRRYMEEGPELAVQDKLMYCLPIDKQKESFDLGDTLIRFSMWVPGTRSMGDFMSIILFGESLARWLATMTCRIPKWPKEIEDVCKIEPDDPYVRDGSTNDVRASLAPAELGFR